MSALRVILLRAAVLAITLGLFGAPLAHAEIGTGGGSVPEGIAAPTDPVRELLDPSAAPDTAPAAITSPLTAAITPVAPPLKMISRRAEDPVATDLGALARPSRVVTVDGHVIVVRDSLGRSELVDYRDPAAPVVLLSSTRAFGVPHAGHDPAGHPVVVASPCAGTAQVLVARSQPNCPLRVIDLTDLSTRALPGTAGAVSGDMAGDRLVFARLSPASGVRLYETVAGATSTVRMPSLTKPGDGWRASLGKPARGSVRAGAYDVLGDRLAVVFEYASGKKYVSGLFTRNEAGAWQLITAIGTGLNGMGLRHVLGPELDPTGVRAYVEGVVETPSFVARWNMDGTQTTRTSIRRSIGRTTILTGAAYDGDRLVFVDWLPGAPCGAEGAPACGIRAAGPLNIS